MNWMNVEFESNKWMVYGCGIGFDGHKCTGCSIAFGFDKDQWKGFEIGFKMWYRIKDG